MNNKQRTVKSPRCRRGT